MKNILVIRRDNIGDMVCTTPLLEGIKRAYPDAKLTLLVNKVAQDVVTHNPWVDRLFVYKKAKHRAAHETTLGVYWQRLKIMLTLRRTRFDATILANPVPCKYSLRLAKMAGANNIIGAGEGNPELAHSFARSDFRGQHQVEHTYSYLSALTTTPPPVPEVSLFLSPEERATAGARVQQLLPGAGRIYGVHISSRSAKRRWPLERYAAFIHQLLADEQAQVLIFWSPQGTLHPGDVGDDARAESLLQQVNSPRVARYATASVRELIAGFDRCEQILCSDGGQMHLAAGLHKKQVVFFGDTNAALWHPWSGQYEILQTESGDCVDVTGEQVWQAWQKLQAQ
ncbi:glycosyltransferase family 9 protein [Candidatus Pantoea multigeneris]|uniref:Glycosyltransferase family 9 protein n=1 Tax=Candidatus Pantoea multigeneris TaxID=2608357 RepID=A0ABX0RH36_9GAMM|nr:glycosyltransferase family 9 protein [Pantoea multigeneris]NIF24109.1 glycosyltransferase family 9 protein [Pantoea multigeneris]